MLPTPMARKKQLRVNLQFSTPMKQLRMPTVTLDRAGIAIAVLLLGCMGVSNYISYAQKKEASSYPHSAIIQTSSGSHVATVEVQASREGQVKGLSGRASISPASGMLFPVRPAKLVQVWMKGMNFPLDILFVNNGAVTQVVENAQPCTEKECPLYNSNGPVDTVIELHPNSQVKVGTKLKVLYQFSSESEK